MDEQLPPDPLRVLYVEDDPIARQMLCDLLSEEGYDVVSAGDVHAAIKEMTRQRFDLVLVDYVLPDGTGAQFLERAKTDGLLERTSAMVVTANAQALAPEDVPIVFKPFEVQSLLAQVLATAQRGRIRRRSA